MTNKQTGTIYPCIPQNDPYLHGATTMSKEAYMQMTNQNYQNKPHDQRSDNGNDADIDDNEEDSSLF